MNPEMCTKAFCKMFEILAGFQLKPAASTSSSAAAAAATPSAGHPSVRARAVHLCEAPGAFVAATSHYLRQQYGDALDYDWRGVTLNPYYEGNDPQLTVEHDGFLLSTFDRWMFGYNDVGDIRSSKCVTWLQEKIILQEQEVTAAAAAAASDGGAQAAAARGSDSGGAAATTTAAEAEGGLSSVVEGEGDACGVYLVTADGSVRTTFFGNATRFTEVYSCLSPCTALHCTALRSYLFLPREASSVHTRPTLAAMAVVGML